MFRNPRLHEICQRRGMTKDLAEACGLTAAAVSAWPAIPARHALTVSRVLKCSIDSLVDCIAFSAPAPTHPLASVPYTPPSRPASRAAA